MVEIVPTPPPKLPTPERAQIGRPPKLRFDPNELSAAQLEVLMRVRQNPIGPWVETWEPVAGPIEDCLSLFTKGKLIEPAPLCRRLDVKFRASDLKPLLKERGAKVSGKKSDLIARLIRTTTPHELAYLVSEVRLYQLTPLGEERTQSYEAKRKQELAAMEAASLAALMRGNLEEAGRIAVQYQSRQFFPRSASVGSLEVASYLLHAKYDDLSIDMSLRVHVASSLALSSLLGETVPDAARRVFALTAGAFACPALEAFVEADSEGLASRVFGDLTDFPDGSQLVGTYVQTKLAEASSNATLHAFRQSACCLGVEILADGDCPVCSSRPRRYRWADLDGGTPVPQHWGCTCCLLPWIES